MKKRIYIAFYIGKKSLNDKATLQDRIICMIDGSDYSHVELVLNINEQGIGDCISSSNRDGGVRRKDIQLSNGRWALIPVAINVNDVLCVFSLYQDAQYDYLGLGSTRWGWFPNIPNRLFCSELIGKMLGVANAENYGIKKIYELVTQKANNHATS